ncbi:hypothetical protein [Paenibacillus xylanilyticus]|uniref:Oligosaccharide repeat unit polymerase n=1 Tax=Paenibacillus xylanilyticus TaxID=248903 RepID=A0A7Y6BUT4_9BACL|nr:hypothetical protein [Paenibacillus xylanilyticus]NUU75299.1 hypothetical protein [Paenibacillus xylanilyticus]
MNLVKNNLNKIPNDMNKNLAGLIFIIIITSSISTFFLVFDKDVPRYYSLLPILPCSFGLISCIFANIYSFFLKSISITIITSTYFIRFVIIPICLSVGGFSTKVVNIDAYSYIEYAILLMVFELFVVYCYLSLNTGRYLNYRKNNQIEITIKENNTKSSLLFRFIIISLFLYVVFVLIRYPEEFSYLGLFTQFSESDRILSAKNRLYAVQIVPGIIDTFYTLFISILQVFIPILCIQTIKKKYGMKNKKRAANLSILVVLCTAIIMTSEKAYSVTIAISLFLIIFNLYPSLMKKRAPYLIMIMIVFVFGGLIFKSGANQSDDFLAEVSTILNAYFSGPINIAVSFMLKNDITLNIIFSDLGNSIPLVKYFFQDLNTSPKLFNLALYGNKDNSDQIIPLLGQGYFYFGFLIAPILTVIVVKIALILERLVHLEKNLFTKYIYIHAVVILSLVPVLYNLNIMINSLLLLAITLFIAKSSKNKLI